MTTTSSFQESLYPAFMFRNHDFIIIIFAYQCNILLVCIQWFTFILLITLRGNQMLRGVPTAYLIYLYILIVIWDRHGRNRMVVRFTTTYAISAYHHWSCDFEPRSWRGVLDTTLCDKVCQWLATGRWFSLVSSINISEILLKVALSTITFP